MNLSVIQSMIDALEKPAIFIRPDYSIQAVNRAYLDTYKQPVKLGRSRCHEISHHAAEPCDRHGEECPLLYCQQHGRSTSVVHVHHTQTGLQHCDILMRPVRDEDGMTLGYLEILNKVTFAAAGTDVNKMVGVSAPFNRMLNLLNRAASADISVLLQGETGTGKELAARAVHDASLRHDKPFVIIECTGLSEALFESELFGHEKGAFTGASQAKKGLVELANGGTLFFDEIGDVPLNMQVKLLRLLETRSFRAVGGLHPKRSDFRLVCASHKDLLAMVEAGEFRQDLYYRIAGFPIQLPALRERPVDIPLLVEQFLLASTEGKHFSNAAMQKLCTYSYPGNIRELKSIVEQASLIANDSQIQIEDLPQVLQNHSQEQGASGHEIRSLEALEGDYLAQLCQTFPGSFEALADALGVSDRTLYRKLHKFGLRFR
ncbi:sigma-54 interaction domain-containing protein [Bowmanella yangjiangensis]|uniref:sigma-54 interaction domain-containing protein n=1 Tax=Bowmanella yangjiangensis TaxID=2811230 RepID=UPI001E5B48EE|nr:sigma-54-dependent Fis family transcriptional regulator [Bowmanella yangjiangensis]